MTNDQARKGRVIAILAAVSIVLSWAPWGIIPWVRDKPITLLHVPVILGALLEGPVAGLAIGAVYGLSSLVQASISPHSSGNASLNNLWVWLLPALLIGPIAWGVSHTLGRWRWLGPLGAGLVASLGYSASSLGIFAWLTPLPAKMVGAVMVYYALPTAAVSAVLSTAIVVLMRRMRTGHS
jgi:uncharacterized membrane protein